MNNLFTAAEAAEYLRVTYLTICRLARAGKLPATKIGGKWRFRKEALDELLRQDQMGSSNLRAILVVDDEASVRGALEEIISREGFRAVTAASGEDGLTELRKRRFALVFLDLLLPGIDGIETLRRMQQLDPNVLVAIITGHADESIALEALSTGPLLLLRKPIGVQDIRKALRFVNGSRPVPKDADRRIAPPTK